MDDPTGNDLFALFVDCSDSEEAFEQLMSHYSGLVFSSAFRRSRSQDIAEEVTQNVFAILYRKARSLSRERSLTAWLFQTTKLETANLMRSEERRRRKIEAFAKESSAEPFQPNLALEGYAILDELIDGLPEKDRTLLLQRFFDGMKFSEIASATGRSEAACKMKLTRVLKRLAQILSARGVTITVASLSTALSSELCKAAPAGFTLMSSNVVATSKTISSTTIILNSIRTMSNIKSASAVIVGVGLLSLIPFVKQRSEASQLRKELTDLQSLTTQLESNSEESSLVRSAHPSAQIAQPPTGKINAEQFLTELAPVIATRNKTQMIKALFPVARMSPLEVEELLDSIQRYDGGGNAKRWAMETLSLFTLDTDPEATLDRRLELGRGAFLLKDWATKDPEAAVAWFEEKIRTGALAGKGVANSESDFFRLLVIGIAKTDADLAQTLVKEAPIHLRSPALDSLDIQTNN